jgi:hypothetical protein
MPIEIVAVLATFPRRRAGAARSLQPTNCTSSPLRRIRKCAETRNAATDAKYGWPFGSRLLVNNWAMASPPNSPGGSEIPHDR